MKPRRPSPWLTVHGAGSRGQRRPSPSSRDGKGRASGGARGGDSDRSSPPGAAPPRPQRTGVTQQDLRTGQNGPERAGKEKKEKKGLRAANRYPGVYLKCLVRLFRKHHALEGAELRGTRGSIRRRGPYEQDWKTGMTARLKAACRTARRRSRGQLQTPQPSSLTPHEVGAHRSSLSPALSLPCSEPRWTPADRKALQSQGMSERPGPKVGPSYTPAPPGVPSL